MSQTIMERLRAETKLAHQQLEKMTIPYIKQSTDEKSYATVLKMFYGYFRPLEELIQAQVGEDTLGDIRERRQAGALLADLQTIGFAEGELPVSHDLPEITTVPQALGAMYVMEGSTLGGRFISQMLSKQMNRDMENGITFFNGYGDQTEIKWKNFTEIMNAYVTNSPADANEIVESANNTFSKFGNWIALANEKVAVTI